MPKTVKYQPKVSYVDEAPKEEFTGSQRFSDMKRMDMQDGFLIIRAKRTSDQAGDKHGRNIRDKLFTPREAMEWVSTAEQIAMKLFTYGDIKASTELTEIAQDLRHKIKEALEWREKHNFGPDEKNEILKWRKQYY